MGKELAQPGQWRGAAGLILGLALFAPSPAVAGGPFGIDPPGLDCPGPGCPGAVCTLLSCPTPDCPGPGCPGIDPGWGDPNVFDPYNSGFGPPDKYVWTPPDTHLPDDPDAPYWTRGDFTDMNLIYG